jgi:hypothetical protein
MNNNPFIFIIEKTQKINSNFIKIWIDELNKNINDERLLFEYYINDNSIFYVILKIDGNKVLNIFRAESYNNIIWQYCLSAEFMNNIFKKRIEYFYKIMKNYYIVVEKQMNIYLYFLKNNIGLNNMIENC